MFLGCSCSLLCSLGSWGHGADALMLGWCKLHLVGFVRWMSQGSGCFLQPSYSCVASL